MSNSYQYSIEDVKFSFTHKDYVRGQEYAKQRRVLEVKFNSNNQISALVRGSRSSPYAVKVQIFDNGDRKGFSGHCTCPLAYGCKHIVATLLEGMKYFSSYDQANNMIDVTPLAVLSDTLKQIEVKEKLDYNTTVWLDSLEDKQEEKPLNNKVLIYVIEPNKNKEGFSLSLVTVTLLKSGVFSSHQKPYRLDHLIGYNNRAKHISDKDIIIAKLISTVVYNLYGTVYEIPSGEVASLILKLILASGRCYLPGETSPAQYLTEGELRKATLRWEMAKDGTQSICARVDGSEQASVFILQEPYYICPISKTIGIADFSMPYVKAAKLLNAPHIKPEYAAILSEELKSKLNTTDLLPAIAILPIRKLSIEPIPRLHLNDIMIQPLSVNGLVRRPSGDPVSVSVMRLSFDYEGQYLEYTDIEDDLRIFKSGEVIIASRHKLAEDAAIKLLEDFGFTMKLEDIKEYYDIQKADRSTFSIGSVKQNFHKDKQIAKKWELFIQEGLPKIRELGWEVIMGDNFSYNVVYADDEWYAEIEEGSGIEWFGVELGVTIDGERLNLVPILLNLLKKGDDIFEIIRELPSNNALLVEIGDGRRIALPSERAKILLSTLQNLFSFHESTDALGKLKIQALEAGLLAEIEAAAISLNMRWFGGERVRSLGKRLVEFTAISDVLVPKTFGGQLRQYQQDGLNWLQFLREYNLAGILADDMGLGKTVQILAHIATEQASGRLKQPFLVIAPTSLMINWRLETERFVPNLKLLTLHGSGRKEYFKDIHKYDLILTTYPLLLKDKDELLRQEYHTVILDEAQSIKNSRAKVTQIVNQLQANHRLCMTGTPIENHLGELWSLFHFLLPGYLGTLKQFNSLFRAPIEKGGDSKRSEILLKRIKPFVLRRTKQEVVTELPPKTEIVRMIELEGAQRDLYETIRVSMYKKIQNEIEIRGVAKSHIIILDALLKLRQVCCDPVLLKFDTTNCKSVKREELMAMLSNMIEEGRKILLFSQFTSMLTVIKEELDKVGISYTILTGQTKDRETPIRQFQEGKVGLFLISLKAGGIGLNLTAADTVIHYDPWWNPAVEQQATDRAYRIGQDKPVFVYKLVTSGTVEEKIIEMQAKKRELMNSLFDPAAQGSNKISANDIESLFEPLGV
ncbi:MAG: SNF2-related protein [Candidatus Lariskella arthropodorum]